MGANRSHHNVHVFGPRQEMALVSLLDVVLEKPFFIGCYMFRRPRRLVSISNLPAIRTLNSGDVFCKLSVDE